MFVSRWHAPQFLTQSLMCILRLTDNPFYRNIYFPIFKRFVTLHPRIKGLHKLSHIVEIKSVKETTMNPWIHIVKVNSIKVSNT